MRKSYAAVLLMCFGILGGCGMMKQFMPAPTANKTITVPANAERIAFDTPDGIMLPEKGPGDYYFVESDTRNVVLFFNVPMGESARADFTPHRRDQLDDKRKYDVFYVVDPASTQPSAQPAAMPATPAPAPAPAPAANPLGGASTEPTM